MNLKCNECNGSVSTRIKAQRWVTLKCDCKIVIIYFDGCIKEKTKDQYDAWKKERGFQNV